MTLATSAPVFGGVFYAARRGGASSGENVKTIHGAGPVQPARQLDQQRPVLLDHPPGRSLGFT